MPNYLTCYKSDDRFLFSYHLSLLKKKFQLDWLTHFALSAHESTKCRCSKIVDELGLHGLSCDKNAVRFPRHSVINSILKRSLTCTGLPSTLEPFALTNDGRRPDGLTLGP